MAKIHNWRAIENAHNVLCEYITLGEAVRGIEAGELSREHIFRRYLLISNRPPYRIISVSMNAEKVKLYSPYVIHKLKPALTTQTIAVPLGLFLLNKKYHQTRLAKFITIWLSTVPAVGFFS